jgi:hypothetical protein
MFTIVFEVLKLTEMFNDLGYVVGQKVTLELNEKGYQAFMKDRDNGYVKLIAIGQH